MAVGAVFQQLCYFSKFAYQSIGFLEYSTFDFSVKHTTGIWLSESVGVRLAVVLWFIIAILQGNLKPT